MVQGSKTKIKWALINAWQSDSTFLVRLPLLSGQELRNHSLLPVFVNKVLLEHSHAHSFTYRLAAFVLKLHTWVVAPKTTRPTEPRMFTLWPFTKKVCQPLELKGPLHAFFSYTSRTFSQSLLSANHLTSYF